MTFVRAVYTGKNIVVRGYFFIFEFSALKSDMNYKQTKWRLDSQIERCDSTFLFLICYSFMIFFFVLRFRLILLTSLQINDTSNKSL